MNTEKESFIEKIKNESRNGKIACWQALKLAEDLHVPPREISAILNELGIKIAGCQLGCFP